MTLYISKSELFAAAARFISTEQSRPYLQGVYIQPSPQGGAILVATDGHRMFVGYDDSAEWMEEDPASAIWHVAKPKLPAAAFNASGLSLDGVSAQFLGNDGNPVHIMPCRKDTDNTFPDWTHVLPDTSLETVPMDSQGYDAAYIADFAEVSRRLSGQRKVPFVARHIGDSPALISIPNRADCFGVLMPMRLGSQYGTGHDYGIDAKMHILSKLE